MAHELPVELVIKILDHVYYRKAGQSDPDSSTLVSASLVSPAWTVPAQKYLFHSVKLSITAPAKESDSSRLASFLVATDSATARGSLLASFVREMDLSVHFHDSISRSADAGKDEQRNDRTDEFASLLARCLHLYSLKLHFAGIHTLHKSVLAQLSSANLRIRALNIQLSSPSSHLFFQLLSTWPSIRFLRLASEIALPVPRYPCKAALYELALHRTLTPAQLEWLLAGSAHTLRILEFRDLPGYRAKGVLAPHMAGVRALRFMRYDLNSAALVRLCPCLEELVVYHVPAVVRLANLPQTLEHFGFRNPPHSFSHTLEPVLSAIATLPNLRVVTCDARTEDHIDYKELQRVCSELKAELRLDPSPFWIYEDPVVVDKFPRRRMVDNFFLMN